MLSKIAALKLIDLHGLGDHGILRMCDIIEHNPLSPVSQASQLAHIHLGPVIVLVAFVDKLESLNLEINQLGDQSIGIVAEVIVRKPSAKRLLFVGSNQISEVGLATICDAVMKLSTISLLDVGF
jgi:hypothetical protein